MRRQDIPKIPKRHRWTFQTKLVQAADLVLRAAEILYCAGKELWVVVDGAYAKRPFVRPVIVKEKSGPQFFYCTDPQATVQEIIETFADRAAIENIHPDYPSSNALYAERRAG